MYAETRRDALNLASELSYDLLIGGQGIIFRAYEPLKTFEIGINGQRFCNEWRFFFLREEEVAFGYYWSGLDDLSFPYLTDDAFSLVKETAKRISENTNFFVIDIAEKESGGWVVVEINDGGTSGLSMIDPDYFYRNLSESMKKFEL